MSLRKFQKKGGFSGGTDHIECNIVTGESFIVLVDGEKINSVYFLLPHCRELVIMGEWVELETLPLSE